MVGLVLSPTMRHRTFCLKYFHFYLHNQNKLLTFVKNKNTMKKNFLILLTISLLISCADEPKKGDVVVTRTETFYAVDAHRKCITEITHEGCQYIGSFNGYDSDWGTHKGNCTNSIHNTNKVKPDTIWGTPTCPVK